MGRSKHAAPLFTLTYEFWARGLCVWRPFTQSHARFARRYEFFQPMITRVVENKLRTSGAVNTPLCDVSKKEGRAMARGLAISMVSSLTAEAGVDVWIMTHKALIQFDKEEAWFR